MWNTNLNIRVGVHKRRGVVVFLDPVKVKVQPDAIKAGVHQWLVIHSVRPGGILQMVEQLSSCRLSKYDMYACLTTHRSHRAHVRFHPL
jgi:hypothetical protein